MTVLLDVVHAMYGHSKFTNARLLDAAEKLSAKQLHEPVPGAQGSILEVLVHMMGAQMSWTRRFQQLDPVEPPLVEATPDIASLRQAWAVIDAGTDDYLATLTEEDLDDVIHFRSWYGWEGDSPRWQAMLHQAFHQHQHRGEVAMALTALGYSPGELDIFDYLEDETYSARPRAT